MDGPSRLKKWRDDQGISQSELGRRIDVSAASVCDWEAGKKIPDSQNLLKLDALTGGAVPLESWLEHEAERAALQQSLARRAAAAAELPAELPPTAA